MWNMIKLRAPSKCAYRHRPSYQKYKADAFKKRQSIPELHRCASTLIRLHDLLVESMYTILTCVPFCGSENG